MAARPYWRGQIRLALVSIPVEIYSATKSGATIAFNQIHEPSGKRIKYEKVVPGIGPVDVEDIVKGFEYAKGEYVLLDEKEIEGVKLESKKTLELTQFVDSHEIDAIYFEKPYYVVPADDLAEEAFIVLREALRRSHKIGLGQLAMRGREYVVSIKACGRGLGGVDKFEPVSGGGEMDHAEEAIGQLVVAGCDGTVDFEVPEHTLDAVALLVERSVMLDLHPAV
ncbi:Non-homologous end joining protein Ku [Sphingobium sp. AntQ-1]|nr:Non-homologous end joining protein Ku [Sphingobium sp. AntQ-1]